MSLRQPAAVLVSQNAVQLDARAADAPAAIRLAARPLLEARWVTPAYVEAAVAREAQYPTGLPTRPEPIAVPHADPDGVAVASISLLRLLDPVPFIQMATSDITLPVRLVLLLALRSKDQARMLSALIRGLRDVDLLTFLLTEASARAIARRLSIAVEREAGDG